MRPVCMLAALVLILSSSLVYGEALTVYFVDAGTGSATFLHQPGKCAMLINSGPKETSERLLEVMHEAGVNTLDFVVITHPQKEYFSGMQGLAGKIKILELSDNGDMNEEEEEFDAYSRLQFNLPYSVLARGDSWRCGDLGISVLHPPPSYDSGEDYSGRSLVLRISYNSFKMLLLGDVSREGKRKMLQSDQEMNSMVLQAEDLADSGAMTNLLLDRVEPKIAILNSSLVTGEQQEDRLAARNVRVFSIDRDGTIQLRVAENGNIRLKP